MAYVLGKHGIQLIGILKLSFTSWLDLSEPHQMETQTIQLSPTIRKKSITVKLLVSWNGAKQKVFPACQKFALTHISFMEDIH